MDLEGPEVQSYRSFLEVQQSQAAQSHPSPLCLQWVPGVQAYQQSPEVQQVQQFPECRDPQEVPCLPLYLPVQEDPVVQLTQTLLVLHVDRKVLVVLVVLLARGVPSCPASQVLLSLLAAPVLPLLLAVH